MLRILLNFGVSRYMYLKYMKSKLGAIHSTYIVSKWIHMYLTYIANLTRLPRISSIFLAFLYTSELL